MARLFTSGFEVGSPSTFSLAGEDAALAVDSTTWGSPVGQSLSSTRVRSGALAYQIVTADGGAGWGYSFTGVVSNTYYMRWCVYCTAYPSGNSGAFGALYDSTGFVGLFIEINTSGFPILAQWSNNAAFATSSQPLTLNAWNVVEVSIVPSTGVTVMRINGVQVASGTNPDIPSHSTLVYSFGASTFTGGSWTAILDDIAINDSTGAAQNSWCGSGKVVLLLPISDNSNTGFTGGYQAVDNIPPAGVVLASATSTSQIYDIAVNTTDNYRPNLRSYSAAGVTAQPLLVQGLCNQGGSTATSESNGLSLISNPAISEVTASTGTTIATTFPTGWSTFKTAVSYSPSVSLGVSPVMQFRKNTAATEASMCDFMGLYIEYLSASTFTPQRTLTGVGI